MIAGLTLWGLDLMLPFSNAQAVTAAAASTEYYDTGPLASGNTGREGEIRKKIVASSQCLRRTSTHVRSTASALSPACSRPLRRR